MTTWYLDLWFLTECAVNAFSNFLLYRYSNFFGYVLLLYYGKFKKKLEKIKNKTRKYTLKTMKILRTTSLGFNFTGSYEKKESIHQSSKKFSNTLHLRQFLVGYWNTHISTISLIRAQMKSFRRSGNHCFLYRRYCSLH